MRGCDWMSRVVCAAFLFVIARHLDAGHDYDLGAETSQVKGTHSKIRFQRLPRSERLPQAHTCFNLVELPAYADYDTLKSKFDFAIAGVEDAIGRE